MFDELYPKQAQAVSRDIATRGLPAMPAKEPGMFSGLGQAVGGSIMQGGAMAARGLGMVGSVIPQALEARGPGVIPIAEAMDLAFGKDREPLTDKYFRALDDITKPAVDYWKPKAENIGTASQIVGGFARITLPLMAGGGNPSLLIAGEQVGAYDELTAQGVDGGTANKAALVRGVSTAVGTIMPAALVPGRLAAAAAGGVANAAIGVADRAATKMILESADYKEIAAQYQPLDGAQIAIDALVGVAAGAAAGRARVTPEQHAAALTMNATHIADDATLVTASDPVARTQAIDAQTQAAMNVEAGRPVVVDVQADPARIELARADAEARMREIGITEEIAPLPESGMTPAVERQAATADGVQAEQADPVRALVDANPDRLIRMDDGTDVRAADLFDQVEREVAQIDTDAKAYDAAVTCFIRHGDL